MLRVAAQVMMIAVRIVDLGKYKAKLYVSCLELHHSLVGTYPLRIRVRIPRTDQSTLLRFLGPDTYIFVMRKKEAFLLYVSRVGRCVLTFFKDLGQVAMCYVAVVEAFSLSAAVGDEAVKHVFFNSTKLLDEMSENRQHIHAELLRHKGLIERILVGIGSPCSADTLISTVGSSLNVAQKTRNAVGATWDVVGDVVKKGVGSTVFGFTGY